MGGFLILGGPNKQVQVNVVILGNKSYFGLGCNVFWQIQRVAADESEAQDGSKIQDALVSDEKVRSGVSDQDKINFAGYIELGTAARF